MVHWCNEAQPLGVAGDVKAGAEQSLAKLHNVATELSEEVKKTGSVDEGKLGRFLKMLNIHNANMKYELILEDRSKFSNTLLDVYRTCRLSILRKESILQAIRRLLSKKYLTVPSFSLPWEELWDEALDLVTRSKSRDSLIADNGYGQVPLHIADLLHTCRAYIPDAEVESVVSRAMSKLEDVTQSSCAEGLLLLINCLPTAYKHYDVQLPRWVAIWDRLRHNQCWDACWLTLFCRARKHSDAANPAWATISSLLQEKFRTYLSLPGASSMADGHFPFRFHTFYDPLIPTLGKAKAPHAQVAVMKAAKILYSFTLHACPAADLVEMDPLTLSQSVAGGSADVDIPIPGYTASARVRPATAVLVALLQSIRPFLYPSSTGAWSNPVACLLAVLCSEMSRHAGRNLARVVTATPSGSGSEGEGMVSHAAQVLAGHAIFEKPVHLGTLRYLLGTMCSLAIEGVYSKSPTVQQLCAASLRNLVGLDPTLGRVVMPFLLQSLDPAAVSQSHQAPAAMGAIALLTKPLLFPCPLMLDYLPQLLDLSLPGVDANDVKKSVVTLKVYSGILAGLPIRAAYATPPSAASYPPPYLNLLSCDDPTSVDESSPFGQSYAAATSPAHVEAALAKVATAFEAWAPRLLDRLFGLLDASEEPKKSAPPSSTATLIELVVHNLFLALKEGDNEGLRRSLEDRLVSYFRDSNNVKAHKVCARVAGQCAESPGFLTKLVTALATAEVLGRECSNDRLVCRLSILGGAARHGPKEELLAHMATLTALLGPAFTYHQERTVRKAAVKLSKEVMRGLTSYYPVLLPSARGTAELPVLGAPTDRSCALEGLPGSTHPAFRWHGPTQGSVAAAVALMKATAYPAMEEIRADLRLAQAATGTGTGTGTESAAGSKGSGGDGEKKEAKKKTEERVAFRLKLVGKVLRGSAEVLGDALAAADGMDVEAEATQGGADAEEEDALFSTVENAGPSALLLPIEGLRARAAEGVTDEEALVLASFRREVLLLLLEVRTALRLPAATATATATTSTSASASADGEEFSSSVVLHKAWVKLFSFLVCRRSCTNKNMEMAKRFHGMSLNMAATMLSKTMRRSLRLMHPPLTLTPGSGSGTSAMAVVGPNSFEAWKAQLACRSFWDGHGIAADEHVRRAYIQHYVRQNAFSFQAVRRALCCSGAGSADGSVSNKFFARRQLLACLNFLSDVCCHEYDAVREAGRKAFSEVVTRFGVYANTMVRRMLRDVLSPAAAAAPAPSYARVVGALRCVLGSSYLLGRIQRDWALTAPFLSTLCGMPRLIAEMDTDPAKKQDVTLAVASLLVRHISKWSHLPIKPAQRAAHDPAAMITTALARVGVSSAAPTQTGAQGEQEQEQGQASSMEVVTEPESGSSATVATTTTTTTTYSGLGGIRFDAFNSYLVLGMLAHPEMPVPPPQVWTWALQTTATSLGQPSQQIAWAALARLCMMQAQAQAQAQAGEGTGSPAAAVPPEVRQLLRCQGSGGGGDQGIWPHLLPGIAAAHPKGGDEGDQPAQWSGGVDSVLKAANMAMCPHRNYSLAFEGNVVSPYFMRESCVLFVNMCRAGLIDILDEDSVGALLDVAKASLGPGGSDAETRRNSVAHAELFGGVLRAVADLAASQEAYDAGTSGASEASDGARVAPVVQLLLRHYQAAVEKLSLEFAKDWDEALLLALSGPPTHATAPFLEYVASSFKLAIGMGMGMGASDADMLVDDESEASGEGFNQQGKRMVSTAVVLRALITSSWQAPPSSPQQQGRTSLAADLASSIVSAKHGIISPYRTSRFYMSGILRALLVRGQHGGSFSAEQLRALYTPVAELAESALDSSSGPGPEAETSSLQVSSSSSSSSSSSGGKDRDKDKEQGKHALEVACALLDTLCTDFPIATGGLHGCSEAQRAECERSVVVLCRCAIKGCGHPDPEVASRSRQSAVNLAETVTRGLQDGKGNGNGEGEEHGDVLAGFLHTLRTLVGHASFRVRLVVVECAMLVMMNRWTCLTAPERTSLKDIFTAGFSDTVPEVLQQAQAGFAGYLGFKTPSELRKLGEAFCRNSDKYVTLAKQNKKKGDPSGDSSKPDVKFTNMVQMMCCIVLSQPYDLPPFLPQLLACTVRHANTPALKQSISRTVLEFRRTHQDRWEEFKDCFSADQLDALSGATQVSYMS